MNKYRMFVKKCKVDGLQTIRFEEMHMMCKKIRPRVPTSGAIDYLIAMEYVVYNGKEYVIL